ncbi:stromal interaction molecule 2 [Trichonephila clavipes]|nr:stromal interaction molecule 2 [Trichonephila clavipes]
MGDIWIKALILISHTNQSHMQISRCLESLPSVDLDLSVKSTEAHCCLVQETCSLVLNKWTLLCLPFFRDELNYKSGYERQKRFHRNDKHISVDELWSSWKSSEVHDWTVEETVQWLLSCVDLPQYTENFKEHSIDGTSLPRSKQKKLICPPLQCLLPSLTSVNVHLKITMIGVILWCEISSASNVNCMANVLIKKFCWVSNHVGIMSNKQAYCGGLVGNDPLTASSIAV